MQRSRLFLLRSSINPPRREQFKPFPVTLHNTRALRERNNLRAKFATSRHRGARVRHLYLGLSIWVIFGPLAAQADQGPARATVRARQRRSDGP